MKNKEELSPKYKAFNEKIDIERDSDLLNELQYNPYNQTNKIFVAKVHGFVEKTEPKKIEVVHNVPQFNSIERYKLEEK